MSQPGSRIEELSGEILAIARAKATGTFRIAAPQGLLKQFVFHQGCLTDLDPGDGRSLLEVALLSTGAFNEKDLKRARKAMSRSEKSLAASMLDIGGLSDADLGECIRRQLTEEICIVFEWPPGAAEFIAHAPNERPVGFSSELGELCEVFLDAEELVLDAVRSFGRWDIVQRNFSLLGDVVYATPASFRYFREQDDHVAEYALVSKVDGIKDVEEVIAESGLDPFEALLAIRLLQAQGELELINPVQMYQLGVECAAAENHAKAAKLFRRARQRGLDDFDLQLKLAQSLDAIGKRDDAVQCYFEFSDKCVAQGRTEDAIRSLKRVIKLSPDSLQAQEKLLGLLFQNHRSAEAIEQALATADRLALRGQARAGMELLVRVRASHPRETRLQNKIIELAEATNDQQTARAERDLLAKNFEERKDIELALETYQRMFCEGDDSLEVRLKLIELHQSRGNRQKGLDHIHSILNLPEKLKQLDEATLVSLHEAVRQMKPGDIRSNRWLADYFSRKGEKQRAVTVLQGWINHLETEGDHIDVVHAYEQLVIIDDDSEHRWGLAKALEKVGRTAEFRRELRNLARLALSRKDFEQATKALEYILKTSPLDFETRKMQAELCEASEKTELAIRYHEELAVLAMLSGDVLEAEQSCRRVPESHPEAAELTRKFGRFCRDQGDRQKAVEQFCKAAKLHSVHKNHGLCRTAIDEVFAIEPGNSEASALLAELMAREAPKPPVEAHAMAAVAPSGPPEPPRRAPEPPPSQETAPPPPAGETEASDTGREPFQHAKPVRTSVSNIMDKLRKLKAGGVTARRAETPTVPVAAPAPPPEAAAPPRTREESAAEFEASQQTAAEAAPVLASAPTRQPSVVLRSAAARLKALAGKKAQEMERLADAAPQPGATEAATEVGGAPAGDESLNGGQASETPGQSEHVRRPAINKAASKLASLRKQAAN